MTSQFFFLPADAKKTEDERIKFTQSRIQLVKDWLNEKIVNKFTENDFDCRTFLPDFGARRKVVDTKIVTDKDCNITKQYKIDTNYFTQVTDEFCANNRCKIDKMDFTYLLILTFRDNGISVSPVVGTLAFELGV